MCSKIILYFMLANIVLSVTAEPDAEHHKRNHLQHHNRSLRNATLESGAGHESVLHRINERLTSLFTLEEQQLKKLESLDYKITRLEVTTQERTENLKASVHELTRRVQNLDWVASKVESTLEQMRNDFDSFKEVERVSRQTAGGSVSNMNDFGQKLNTMANILVSTRNGVHKLEREMQFAGKNLTHLLTLSKEVYQLQRNVPSKQFLNNAILGLKSQPVYAVVDNNRQPNNLIADVTAIKSCRDVESRKSGVFKIQTAPGIKESFYAFCDQVSENGGWTVIQNRFDGSVNFFRSWIEYKHGFGNLGGEFWIGLDKLYEITSARLHELLIVLEDHQGVTKTAKYSNFAIGGEKENYALNLLGDYKGTAGDSLSYHAGHKFSTFDLDNDGWVQGNCAQAHNGAWWYNACDTTNLNGKYFGDGELPAELMYQGMYWHDFNGANYSLKSAKMMIRSIE